VWVAVPFVENVTPLLSGVLFQFEFVTKVTLSVTSPVCHIYT